MKELTRESIKGKVSLVFFDLDGVILDSLADIAAALNTIAAGLMPRIDNVCKKR